MDKRSFSELEKDKFRKYAEKKAQNSNLFKDCIIAFVVGGIICIIGELLSDFAGIIDINTENTKLFVPCCLIVLSCILTATGLYHKLAKYAGAGTLVPITGFANAMSSISIDSTSEGYILGVGAKMFTIAGPVILYGTVASFIYGLVLFMLQYIG